uniref:Uncharacterized protein n=1 Tax=Oryza brachyantha TaxID=4533 RepID=J3LXV0_ORYBR
MTLLITTATELFLGSLPAGAHRAASWHGRRAVRAVHVRAAVCEHRPTVDFLDCLAVAEDAPPARARQSHRGRWRRGKDGTPSPPAVAADSAPVRHRPHPSPVVARYSPTAVRPCPRRSWSTAVDPSLPATARSPPQDREERGEEEREGMIK